MYDVIIIGSGPAGESAAMNAAKHGLKAAVIEDQPLLGGACTHKGTIPSKILRELVRQTMRITTSSIFQKVGYTGRLAFADLKKSTEAIIHDQVYLRTKYYTKNHIDVYHGVAAFKNYNTIIVEDGDGGKETLEGKHVVIATGCRPYHPEDIDFSHPRVYDSDTILDMAHTPQKIIVYGAGIIGCEYASIFSGLGLKVDLINTRDRLLEFLDDEISDALTYHLRGHGVLVRHRETYQSVVASDDGVTLELESGKCIYADALLWCNGRTGNTDKLGLSNIGLEADHRGQLAVNKHYQTVHDHIYAVGDVIGWPSLASAAYDQGRSAAALARGKQHCRYVDDVATGIYTIPEISSVGKTERELTQEKIPYEVGRALFKDIARAQIRGEKVGMLKILFHAETLEILGVHCFGADATEIIHIGQAIMKQEVGGNTIRYFVTTTFNYPTMAEAYRVAALNGLNRLHPKNPLSHQ